MTEETSISNEENVAITVIGEVSSWLNENGFDNELLEKDHLSLIHI